MITQWYSVFALRNILFIIIFQPILRNISSAQKSWQGLLSHVYGFCQQTIQSEEANQTAHKPQQMSTSEKESTPVLAISLLALAEHSYCQRNFSTSATLAALIFLYLLVRRTSFFRHISGLLLNLVSICVSSETYIVQVLLMLVPRLDHAPEYSVSPDSDQMQLTLIFASLVVRILLREQVAAFLCVVALCCAYPLTHKAQTVFPHEVCRRLLNCLPYGVAIKRRDSSEWLCCNIALCEILGAKEACNALSVMNELLKKAKDTSQHGCGDGGFAEVRVKLTEEEEALGRAAERQDSAAQKQQCDPGEERVVEISGKLIDWEGQAAQLISIRDVTQLTKMDHLRIANSIKTRILRSLSHELRTPINCILNSLEYCKLKLEDDESLANINVALTNSNFLLYKYNDLLDFVKIEMNQLVLDHVVFNFRELVTELNNLFSMQIALKGIQYNCSIDEAVPSEIYSDPNRIRQVILNLIENAIKHNSDNGRLDFLVTRTLHCGNDCLRVEVADTGEGIDKSKLSTLFTMEEIISSANVNKRVSVSLPIAYQICKLLGGELEVQTTSGKGSSFVFYISINKELIGTERSSSVALSSPSEECDVKEDSGELLVVQRPFVWQGHSSLSREELRENFATEESKGRAESKSMVLPIQSLLKQNTQPSLNLVLRRMSQKVLPVSEIHIIPPPEEMTDRPKEQPHRSCLKPGDSSGRRAGRKELYVSFEPQLSRWQSNKDVAGRRLKPRLSSREVNSTLLRPVERQSRMKDFVRKTLMRDPKAIRKNAILTKNSLFIPIPSPTKCNRTHKRKRASGIRAANQIRANLFEYQKAKDAVQEELSPSTSQPVELPAERIREETKERTKTAMPRPKVLLRHSSNGIPRAENNEKKEVKPQTNEEFLADMAKGIAKRLRLRKCMKADCPDILVVDDNEFNRYIMVQLLTKYGFVCRMVISTYGRIQQATNGKRALEEYMRATLSLIQHELGPKNATAKDTSQSSWTWTCRS